VDFLHVDTILLRRIYALIVVEHGSRPVHLAGITDRPSGMWTVQAARNLVMDFDDRIAPVKFLLRDRDSRFTTAFDAVFAAEGIRVLLTPPQAPRANSICERMIGTLRRELLDRLLIVNERHLHRVVTVYLSHFNAYRPHRSLAQLAPAQVETGTPEPTNLADVRVPLLTDPGRAHQRVSPRRMTDPVHHKPAVQRRTGYSSPTGRSRGY